MSQPAATDKAEMQVAVVNASSALTMPQEEFIELYCQPIEDDTWIRHEEIVKMENLVESEGGEAVKKEILKEYIEERARTGQTVPPDPILEGMLAQEQFMEEYELTDRRADGEKATRYRNKLVSTYRRKNPAPETPPAPFGEEDVSVDSDDEGAGKKGKGDANSDDEYPAEEEAPAAAPEAENPAEGAGDEGEQPTGEEAEASANKASPVAGSPKATDAVATEGEGDVASAADAEANADEL